MILKPEKHQFLYSSTVTTNLQLLQNKTSLFASLNVVRIIHDAESSLQLPHIVRRLFIPNSFLRFDKQVRHFHTPLQQVEIILTNKIHK